ncbi:unnamed protein product [Protopolystoma xenopodis]|uniref:Uncharacterized protein n=1 Tax=Protopolystoma xenopodis TaxID=117903 RepID=A0A3S5BL38_9PLAT|nr:unnamed protein product [Protopolystoma xenopodis]
MGFQNDATSQFANATHSNVFPTKHIGQPSSLATVSMTSGSSTIGRRFGRQSIIPAGGYGPHANLAKQPTMHGFALQTAPSYSIPLGAATTSRLGCQGLMAIYGAGGSIGPGTFGRPTLPAIWGLSLSPPCSGVPGPDEELAALGLVDGYGSISKHKHIRSRGLRTIDFTGSGTLSSGIKHRSALHAALAQEATLLVGRDNPNMLPQAPHSIARVSPTPGAWPSCTSPTGTILSSTAANLPMDLISHPYDQCPPNLAKENGFLGHHTSTSDIPIPSISVSSGKTSREDTGSGSLKATLKHRSSTSSPS